MARFPSSLLRIHPSIRAAVAARRPIVALESTIITHGLPAPQNLQTAIAVEDAVRSQGAVPATIAVLDGKAHVGLDKNQLERLASVGPNATKTSRRDLSSVLAAGRGSVGATTVSGTMILAHLAGIQIFGTGGIGGVHRGGETSMDISADLTELARTPVAVFSSGAKSILDIGRTLEYLETMGVAVHTMSESGHFPAFYTSRSGFQVPKVASARDAARIIHASSSLGLTSGMVFGVPIPAEFEQSGRKIQEIVEQAVKESQEQGIDRLGKQATPWLLKRVSELTQGTSVTSNRALVLNNVTVAAKAAKELQDIQENEDELAKDVSSRTFTAAGFEAVGDTDRGNSPSSQATTRIVVVGFAAVDITSRSHLSYNTGLGTTWPGTNVLSLGGVGRNVAEAAQRLVPNGLRVDLVSPVGQDMLGTIVRTELQRSNMHDTSLIPCDGRTASVSLHLNECGDLVTGVADMSEANLSADNVRRVLSRIDKRVHPKLVVAFDANISQEAMQVLLQSGENSISIFEPTSIAKCTKIIAAVLETKQVLHVATPNRVELGAMYQEARRYNVRNTLGPTQRHLSESMKCSPTDEGFLEQAQSLATLFQGTLLIKQGRHGVTRATYNAISKTVFFEHYEAHPIEEGALVNTTGAGDTFAGAVTASFGSLMDRSSSPRTLLHDDHAWKSIIDVAQAAAVLTLKTSEAVAAQLNLLNTRIAAMAGDQ